MECPLDVCGVRRLAQDSRRPWQKRRPSRPLPGGGNDDGHEEAAESQGRGVTGVVTEKAAAMGKEGGARHESGGSLLGSAPVAPGAAASVAESPVGEST